MPSRCALVSDVYQQHGITDLSNPHSTQRTRGALLQGRLLSSKLLVLFVAVPPGSRHLLSCTNCCFIAILVQSGLTATGDCSTAAADEVVSGSFGIFTLAATDASWWHVLTMDYCQLQAVEPDQQ